MNIYFSLLFIVGLALGSVCAQELSCDLKHSQSFTYSSYGVKIVHIKSAFSSQDAIIVKQTDSQDITVDVNLFTDGTLDQTPVQLTGSQNGALLLIESKMNLIVPLSPPSSVNVSGTDKLGVITSTLILGLLAHLFTNQRYAILTVSIFGLVSLSMENCSPQALFTVTVPAGVQSVCLNDQCFTSSPTANLGVAAHFISPNDREMTMLSGAFSVVRRDMDWGSVEYAPHSYDFSKYVALTNTLLSFNVTPYWIFDYRNSFYDNGTSPVSETGIAGFVAYAMKSLALLNGTDAVWEMYNEPNGGFWTPKANVTQFINLAKAVGAAVKEDYLKEYHIGPAVSGMDFKFLEACFAGGLLEYWDGVSVHPYRGGIPETTVKDYFALALMIERYKPAAKPFIPIISGEWGYSTTTVSPHQQATYLPRMFLANMAMDVVMSIWYDWRDDGTDPNNNEHNFGTVYNAYLSSGDYPFAPKATYYAAHTLKNLTTGMRFNKRIHTESSSVWIVMLSDTPDNVVIAVWSTNTVAETVSLPVSPGSFRLTNYVGNSTHDVTVASGQSLTIQATDEVQYIVPLTTNPYLQVISAVTRPPLIITESLVDFVMFFTNPINEDVTLDFYEQKGVKVAPGQTVALWHHVDVYLDVPAYDLPIFVNFTSFGPLRMQSHVAPVFPILPVVYPTTINGSVPVSFLSSYDLSAHVGVTLNDQSTSFDVTTVSRASPILLVDGRLSNNHTSTVALAISHGDTTYTRGAPLAVSQYIDFSTINSGSLQQTFTAWIGGDTSVSASFKISLAKPAMMPLGFDSYGILFLNSTSAKGYRYFVVDAKVDLPMVGTPTKFGQWVYGDGSGVSAGIRVVDSTGEVFQFLYPITWTGWQYVIYSFDNINDHWGGNNDRVADYPLSWLSLFLFNNPGGDYTQYQGNFYISTLVAYSF